MYFGLRGVVDALSVPRECPLRFVTATALLLGLGGCLKSGPDARAQHTEHLHEVLAEARAQSERDQPCDNNHHEVVAAYCSAPSQATAEAVQAAGLPWTCECHSFSDGLRVSFGNNMSTRLGGGHSVDNLLVTAIDADAALADWMLANGVALDESAVRAALNADPVPWALITAAVNAGVDLSSISLPIHHHLTDKQVAELEEHNLGATHREQRAELERLGDRFKPMMKQFEQMDQMGREEQMEQMEQMLGELIKEVE